MIFLTGPHGAGKTTVAEMLSEYDFEYLDLGGILRRKHKVEAEDINFELWCQQKEKIFGPTFTDDIIVEEVKKHKERILSQLNSVQDLIIVGSRSFRGLKYIINKVGLFKNKKNVIIYIDAPISVLQRHYCLKEHKKISLKRFKELLGKDEKMGISTIIPYADIKILNDGSKKDLRAKVEEIFFFKLGYSRQK